MKQSPLNTPVSITAIGFGRRGEIYPKRMEWQGRTYHFISRGIRLSIRHGEAFSSTVTCSDGRQEFCLRETAGAWTLLSIG